MKRAMETKAYVASNVYWRVPYVAVHYKSDVV